MAGSNTTSTAIPASSKMSFSAPSAPILISALLGYILLVRLLRYRALAALHRDYPYKTRASLATMTNADATKIQATVFETEFPFTAEKALQFALFKTYGIPSISKVLVKTGQFAGKMASRRFADTEVLISEFTAWAPDSDRATEAIARMNYLHNLYRKSGLITDDDLLYTLALFALEPKRWIARYEWRKMSDIELAAFGTFWHALGVAMSIPTTALGPFEDGLSYLDAIEKWSDDYEARTMVHHPNNQIAGDATAALLLWDVPHFLHGFGRQVVAALMDERLRLAMGFEKPPRWVAGLVHGGLLVRKYAIRYLALPRPYVLRRRTVEDEPGRDG
ncbi:hypothetical protein EJ06DRAFT_529415, partial [Trichodelitschia bisporula]